MLLLIFLFWLSGGGGGGEISSFLVIYHFNHSFPEAISLYGKQCTVTLKKLFLWYNLPSH